MKTQMKKSIFYHHIVAAARQTGESLEDMLSYAADLGYRGVDIEWIDAAHFREAHARLAAVGMEIASVFKIIQLSDGYDEAYMRECFNCLTECGCRQVMIVPGCYKEDEEREAKATVAALNEICAIAAEYGVRVTTENFGQQTAVVGDIRAVGHFLDAVPQLFFTLDTGNFIRSNESPLDALEQFGDRITHVHIKDISYAPTFEGDSVVVNYAEVYPSPAGDGFIPVEECIRRLYRMGYDGYLTVEHWECGNMKECMTRSAKFIDRILKEKAPSPATNLRSPKVVK